MSIPSLHSSVGARKEALSFEVPTLNSSFDEVFSLLNWRSSAGSETRKLRLTPLNDNRFSFQSQWKVMLPSSIEPLRKIAGDGVIPTTVLIKIGGTVFSNGKARLSFSLPAELGLCLSAEERISISPDKKIRVTLYYQVKGEVQPTSGFFGAIRSHAHGMIERRALDIYNSKRRSALGRKTGTNIKNIQELYQRLQTTFGPSVAP